MPSPELPAGPPSEPELPPETVAAVVTCGPPVPLVSPSNREPPDMPPSGLEPLDPLGARELRVGLPSEDAAVVAADESPSGPRPELPLGPLRDPPSDPPDEPRSWPLVVTPAAVSLCDMPWSPLRAPMPIRSRTDDGDLLVLTRAFAVSPSPGRSAASPAEIPEPLARGECASVT